MAKALWVPRGISGVPAVVGAAGKLANSASLRRAYLIEQAISKVQ